MNARKTFLASSLSALAIAAGVAVMAPSPADAACCVAYDYGHATTSHLKTQLHFSAELLKTELAIIEALRLHAGQLTGNLKEQMAAEASIADLQDKRLVQSRIEQERLKAAIEAASGASSCNVISSAISAQNMDAFISQWRESMVQAQVNYDLGSEGASRLGTQAAVEKRLNLHCEISGTQADVEAGLCTSVGSKPGAAVNANTVLAPEHGVMSEEDAKAATVFLATALTPKPLGGLPKDIGKTEHGRQLIAARQASAARVSVATSVASSIVANNVKIEDDQAVIGENGEKASLKDWAEGTAKQVLGYDPNGNNFPKGVSKNAWMELRSKAWFMNPNWAVEVSRHGVDYVIKDVAMMQAFQVYQNWELYKQVEQMNLSLATMLTILEEKNREKL